MFHTPDSDSVSRLGGRPSLLFKQYEPGTRVVVSLTQPRDLVDVYAACWERGLVVVPLDPRLPIRTREYIEEHAQPHVVIRDYQFHDRGEQELSPDGDGFIVYTSGTTGNPKGVVLTRAAARHNALMMFASHDLGPKRPHLTAMSLYHVNALMMSFLGGLLTGGDVTFIRDFSASSFLQHIWLSDAVVANVSPTHVAQLNTFAPRTWIWRPEFRYLLSASAPLSRLVVSDFSALYGKQRIHQGYGMSEATNFSFTTHPSNYENEREWEDDFITQAPPVGYPLPETECRIVEGEVQLRAPSLMRCYWRDPDATALAFSDGWLRTGDAGEVRTNARGKMLALTGRIKEIIIRGGENLSPAALDDEYREAGITGDFAAVGIADSMLGEAVGCFGVLPNLARVAPRSRPVAAVESRPIRTVAGKLRRSEMGSRLASVSLPQSSYDALRAVVVPLAKRIADLDPTTPQQRYLWQRAVELRSIEVKNPEPAPEHVRRLVDHLIANLDNWYDGYITGSQVIATSHLWETLMVESPMSDYARLADAVLRRQIGNAGERFHGRVVELGAGVGNLSRHLDTWCVDLTRTDRLIKFLVSKWGSRALVVDFDKPLPEFNADVFVAANALHCSADRYAALSRLCSRLPSGGVLLLAEGEPRPIPSEPWALDIVFGFLDGWWDRGGFVSRRTWLDDLRAVGFVDRGYSELRAGRYDLGGVVWARKP